VVYQKIFWLNIDFRVGEKANLRVQHGLFGGAARQRCVATENLRKRYFLDVLEGDVRNAAISCPFYATP
jgi:hypothetical protein